MLKEYMLPDGSTWQFREGEQPKEAVEVEPKPKAPAKGKRKAK